MVIIRLLMEQNKTEDERIRIRSQRLSKVDQSNKRKRSVLSEEEEEATNAKMAKSTVDFTLADLKVYMNGEFRDSINEDMDNKLVTLNQRIDKTQDELKSHKNHVEQELKKMRSALESGRPPLALVPEKSLAKQADREDGRTVSQYWRARRSSRFFPIDGVTEEELRRELGFFFESKLRMPTGDVAAEDIEHVRRVRVRRGKQGLGEVLVLFADIETRDRVSSYARNLASFRDDAVKPTAGIRFEIPDHLSGVHRTLLQYGHALWVKHGKNPDFKRNIRHDDVELTFCLDVKLSSKKKWVTVSH